MAVPPGDLSALDLNAVIRDALHRRGTDTAVRPYLEAAAAAAAPAFAPVLVEAIWRVLRDVAHQDGIDDGDALHTLAANLARYTFDFGDPGAPAAYAVRTGRLVPQGAGAPSTAAAPTASPGVGRARGGSCSGSILVAILLMLLASLG